MSSLDDPDLDWGAIAALLAVFVVVAAGAGGGTYSVLSANENVSASLTVEPTVHSGMVTVDRIACTKQIKSQDPSTVDQEDVEVVHSEDVSDSGGCARVTFWLGSWLFTQTNGTPEDAVMLHQHQGQWRILDTVVSSEGEGLLSFTAYTDKFTPSQWLSRTGHSQVRRSRRSKLGIPRRRRTRRRRTARR